MGVEATEDVRMDLTGHYFTEWKEWYVMIGFTLVR